MKSLFEQMGGTYTLQGDCYLPNLVLPEEETQPVGLWGQRHARHLKQNHKVLYTNLLTSGKPNSYLADIDEQANEMFLRLVREIAQQENVAEELKAENAMLWIGRMNEIKERAREIVNAELIYS